MASTGTHRDALALSHGDTRRAGKGSFPCDCFFPGIDDVVIQRGSLLPHGLVVRSDVHPESQHHAQRDVERKAAHGHGADVDRAIYVNDVRYNSVLTILVAFLLPVINHMSNIESGIGGAIVVMVGQDTRFLPQQLVRQPSSHAVKPCQRGVRISDSTLS